MKSCKGYNKELTRLAKRLSIALAVHLADYIANDFNKIVLTNGILIFDELNAPLLQASFWVRPIYEELLFASSKLFKSPAAEAARAANGLVKIVCSEVMGAGQRTGQH